MIKRIIYIIVVLFCFSCKMKYSQPKEVTNPGYLAPNVPFAIEKYEECLYLKDLKGSVVFYLFVSKNGRLENFNISKLILRTSEGEAIALFNNFSMDPIPIDDYPDNVIIYYWEFKNYLSELKFVKKEQENIDELNQFYLMNKIGCR